VQHVAVGATHPAAALALYERRLGSAKQMMVRGVHSVPPQLVQNFITCKGADGKVQALRELLGPAEADGKPKLGRVVLFCNSQDSARFVDHHLTEEGYRTANYHGAVPANARADNFRSFISGNASVLVTTDIAARGLDNLDVSHVVQFDFPRSAAEYLHRCGRTARAGRRGASHALVTKYDTELVRALRAAHAKGEDLLEASASAVAATAASATTLRVRTTRKASFPTPSGLAPLGGDEKAGLTVGDGRGSSRGRGVGRGVGRRVGRGVGRGARGRTDRAGAAGGERGRRA
jgi:superfamily II DNA/RNA helicase